MKTILAVAFAVSACGGSANTIDETNAEGTKGGPCYPNNTCNAGFACVASLCTEADGSVATDTTATTDATGDSTTTDSMVVTDSAPPMDTSTPPPYTESAIAAACEDLGDAFEIVTVNGDDVSSDRIALPFAFKLFGDAVTQYSMASNGFLQLWSSSSGGISKRPDNVAIPSADDPNGFVAPFWDDLSPMFSNSRAGVKGTAPNRHLVVAWIHWTIKGETTTRITFQAKLFETTNVIELHYCAMSPETSERAKGSSATIGLENMAGSKGVQHSFNMASVATGKAFRYTP
jgi:hypothetical protein